MLVITRPAQSSNHIGCWLRATAVSKNNQQYVFRPKCKVAALSFSLASTSLLLLFCLPQFGELSLNHPHEPFIHQLLARWRVVHSIRSESVLRRGTAAEAAQGVDVCAAFDYQIPVPKVEPLPSKQVKGVMLGNGFTAAGTSCTTCTSQCTRCLLHTAALSVHGSKAETRLRRLPL